MSIHILASSKNIFLVGCLLLLLQACGTTDKDAKITPPVIDLEKAVKAYFIGDCQQSIQLFLEANATKEHPAALNGLGMSYLLCKQPIHAEAAFKKAISMVSESAALYSNLGTALFELGKIAEAQTAFEQALKIDPVLTESVIGLASTYIAQGKPELALKKLYNLNTENTNNFTAKYNQAIALYEMGLAHDAIALLESFITKSPQDPEAHNAFAVVLLQDKQFKRALDAINIAIELYAVEGSYYYNRANIYTALKEFKLAEDNYDRALAFSPTMGEAYVNRGDLRFLRNNTQGACEDLYQACELGLCGLLDTYKNAGRCLGGIWK